MDPLTFVLLAAAGGILASGKKRSRSSRAPAIKRHAVHSDEHIADTWIGAGMPGYVAVARLKSNGSRPVLVFVPERFNSNKSSLLLLYFHGFGSNISSGMHKSGRFERVAALAMADPQTILVMPEADDEPFSYWMNPKNGESFTQLVSTARDLASEVLGGRQLKVGKIQVEAHSGGGSVISRLAKSGELFADKLKLLDAVYPGWGKPIGEWALSNGVPVDVIYTRDTEKHARAAYNAAPNLVRLIPSEVRHGAVPGHYLGK